MRVRVRVRARHRVRVGLLYLAALPEREVLQPLELWVEQAEEPPLRHAVDLDQVGELVGAGKEDTRRILGGRAALGEYETAAVLGVEHLVGHAALARTSHACEEAPPISPLHLRYISQDTTQSPLHLAYISAISLLL